VSLIAVIAFTHVPLYGLLARPELDPTVVARLGPLRLTAGGVAVGLATALRICALASLALLYAFTTDVMDLVRALVQQWHVSYRFGYGLLAAYRFVPMLETELWTVQAAHRVRGVTHGWGPLGRLRALRRYAIPLLASAIRRAERVALAMDARAFGAFSTRTYRRRLRLALGDYALMTSCWLFTALAGVFLWQVGLLTRLTIAP
jgi:energy-coupling factor transport system permease protein